MNITKTTAAERALIGNACYSIICQVDMAHRLLMNLWEERFGTAEQKDIDSYTAGVIGDTISMICDTLFSGLLEYALMVGDDDFRGVGPHLEGLKEALANIECNKLSNEMFHRVNAMKDGEVKEKAWAKRKEIGGMANEQAIAAFKEWLKEHEREDVR